MTSFRNTALAFAMALALPVAAANGATEAGVAAPSVADAAASAEKQALVKELLRVTGAIDLGRQVQTTMVAGFKQQLPAEHHALIDEVFAELDIGEIEDQIEALYSRNFTEQELRDTIAFYNTPSGRSMMAKMPALMQESVAIGQSWGAAKAEIVIARIREREASKGSATPPPKG